MGMSQERYIGGLSMTNNHTNGESQLARRASDLDSLAYGRMLVDLGVALLQGRLKIVPGDTPLDPYGIASARDEATAPLANTGGEPVDRPGPLTGENSPFVERFIPPAVHGRQNARGRFTARKGYSVVKGKKLDLAGVTPAGVRLMEYLSRNPGMSATQIADDLGLSRKTVENLLSILRQRNLVETSDLR